MFCFADINFRHPKISIFRQNIFQYKKKTKHKIRTIKRFKKVQLNWKMTLHGIDFRKSK